MRHDLRKYLADILQGIVDIELFTSGQTLEGYEQNILVRRGVEREFTIIAEAIRRIGRTTPEIQARIEKVRQIADFRNIIVHQYEDVDDAYVWRVVTESLPVLKRQIETWAAELGRNESA